MYKLDKSLIEQASSFLKGKIRRTPLEHSSELSEILKVPIYLKCEFLQLTGSFKPRGAFFYTSTLKKGEEIAGVSAGNHGLGLALAAKYFNLPCTIFVPKQVDQAKFDKIKKLGAKVIRSEFIGYDDTIVWAEKEVKKNGLHLITAFDDERIMAGNGGSLAVEIVEDLPDVKNWIVPVGGGGLAAGMVTYAPDVRLIGCQHINSPGLKLSLERGKAVLHLPAIETVAGGIEGGLGEHCFSYLKEKVSDVALLSEEQILEGVRWMLKMHQYLIEPTAAVVIAAALFNKIPPLQGPTVIVLTGRNVSYETLKRLINA